MRPYRDALYQYRSDPNKRGDYRLFHDVVVHHTVCTPEGIVYAISFRSRHKINWERAKCLQYGSLLCLSHDEFQSQVWATVAQRTDQLLALDPPQIYIRFLKYDDGKEDNRHAHGDAKELDASHALVAQLLIGANDIKMIESSSVYFEAHRHTLNALQKRAACDLPFAQHVLG